MADPVAQEVKDLWAFMQAKMGSTVVSKSDSTAMKAVSEFLGKLGVASKDDFLKSYATTIANRIYVPFEIGEPAGDWNLWEQACVCVHEHQHVVQYEANKAHFVEQYIASQSGRAAVEGEAYRTYLELWFWRYGATIDPRPIALHLNSYGCRPADVDVVDKSLRMSIPTIAQGAVLSTSMKIALEWLNANAAHWRELPATS